MVRGAVPGMERYFCSVLRPCVVRLAAVGFATSIGNVAGNSGGGCVVGYGNDTVGVVNASVEIVVFGVPTRLPVV